MISQNLAPIWFPHWPAWKCQRYWYVAKTNTNTFLQKCCKNLNVYDLPHGCVACLRLVCGHWLHLPECGQRCCRPGWRARWLLHCSSPETETGKSRELGARTAAEESAAILSSDDKDKITWYWVKCRRQSFAATFDRYFYFKHGYIMYIYEIHVFSLMTWGSIVLYATLAEHAVWRRGRESIEGQSEWGGWLIVKPLQGTTSPIIKCDSFSSLCKAHFSNEQCQMWLIRSWNLNSVQSSNGFSWMF